MISYTVKYVNVVKVQLEPEHLYNPGYGGYGGYPPYNRGALGTHCYTCCTMNPQDRSYRSLPPEGAMSAESLWNPPKDPAEAAAYVGDVVGNAVGPFGDNGGVWGRPTQLPSGLPSGLPSTSQSLLSPLQTGIQRKATSSTIESKSWKFSCHH